jgi:hypothetical protein
MTHGDANLHSHVFLGEGHERNERRTWMVIGLCSVGRDAAAARRRLLSAAPVSRPIACDHPNSASLTMCTAGDVAYNLLCPVLREEVAKRTGHYLDIDCPYMRKAMGL